MGKENLPLKFYYGEMRDHHTYSYLSTLEKDEKMKRMLLGLANIEKRHAEFWKDYLRKRKISVKELKFGLGRKFVIWFMRKILGARIVVSLSEMGESSAISSYYDFYEKGDVDDEEKKRLKNIILDELEHENFFLKEKKILHVENIRDMVLGMNDGLVEILGTVTGLSAVYFNKPLVVGLSGLIVGVAGALSMGIGAYVSVRSQRQVNEGIRKRLRIIFSVSKRRAREEVAKRMEDLGIPQKMAEQLAGEITEKKEKIENIVPVEETKEGRAAIYTGLSYIFGVFFPVVPYFFSPNTFVALPLSVIFAGIALSMVSAVISTLSGISVRRKVAEMLLFGLGAAGLSFLFGTLINILFGTSL